MTITRVFFSLYFLLSATNSLCQSDSVIVKGILVDAFSQKPIENFEIIVTVGYGKEIARTNTDSIGKFEFKTIKDDGYQFELKHDRYIEKHFYIRDTNSVVNIEINLRPRNQSLTYLDIDSTILKSRVKSVFKKFSVDLTDVNEIHEPPGAHRGFDFELGDSTFIYIFIERISFFRTENKKLLNQRIIGLGISRSDGTISFYGEGRPFIVRLNNKYFIEN